MSVRPTVRLRLTLLYGGLFLLTGALLLVVNYGLVRSQLDIRPFFLESAAERPRESSGPVSFRFTEEDEPAWAEARRTQDAFTRGARAFQRRTFRTLLVQSGVALGVMSVVSVGLGWVVAGRVLRPLHRITATAKRLSQENLHERIGMEGPQDELKELADTFDAMLARLDAAFEGQKRFIANASHELRTPLAIQRTLLDVAMTDPDPTPQKLDAMIAKFRSTIDRSERLIDGLLVLALNERPVERWERVDLAAAASAAIAAVDAEASARGITVSLDGRPAEAVGDAALLERAIANLVENAVRHNRSTDGRWVRVTTWTGGGQAVVRVVNTGGDITLEELPELFEPFRRKPQRTRGDGVGLGLSIVRSIALMHNGRVSARPREGGGLIVDLTLPAAAVDATA